MCEARKGGLVRLSIFFLLVGLLQIAYSSAKIGTKSFQDSYAAPPAKLDAIETCSADNWGMPHQTRKPYRTTYKADLQDACQASFQRDNMKPIAHVLANATVNHYLNNKDFDKFIGVDLVPDNHKLYQPGGIWGHSLEYKHVRRDYMKAATCEALQEDGSTWTATRIGPFKTTGGYDWIQVGWDNLWDMQGKLAQHPHGIYVLEQFSGAVTADGTRLGNPPIHIHHIHVGPSPGVRQRADAVGCVLQGKTCYDPTRIFEHHGDYQCTGVSDGDPLHPEASARLDCLTESLPDGYGKLITRPLGLEGDINDARAPNSTVLEWYYQLSARWVPKLDCSEYPQPSDDDEAEETVAEHNADSGADSSAPPTPQGSVPGVSSKRKAKASKKAKLPSAVHPRPKAMSFHNFAGPGDLNDKQSSFVFTYQSPTDAESIFWYTGRMHHSGTLLRLKQHAHNIIFKESLIFAASPAQLGLTAENHLVPTHPYQVVRTKEAGFENNVELKKFILATLQKSHEKFDETARRRSLRTFNSSHTSRAALDTSTPHLLDHGPRAICQAIESMERVDGFMYDRREPTCCVPWEFSQGDIFTVVGFNKIVTEKGAAHQGDHPYIPPTYPGHIGWWISFDTHEVPEKSHYSLIQYTNNPDVQFQDFTNMHEDRIMFLLNGGTSFDPDSLLYKCFRYVVFVYHHPIVFPLMVVLCVLAVRALLYLRKAFAFVMQDGESDLKGHLHHAQD